MHAQKALQQGDDTGSGKRHPLPCFADWLVHMHAQTITRWGGLFVLVMFASACHPIGSLLPYRLFSLGFAIAAARIAMAAAAFNPKLVRRWIATFACLQVGVLCTMAYVGRAPAVHSYLDWATNLTTVVPQMLILDMRANRLSYFVLAYVAAEAAFYLRVVGHSAPVAVLRSVCLHALTVCVYQALRQRACKAYVRAGGAFLGHGAVPHQVPVQGQSEAEALPHQDAVPNGSISGQHSQPFSLRAAAGRQAKQGQNCAAFLLSSPPGTSFRVPYHSRMRHYNITLTLETPEMADSLSEGAILDLTRSLSRSLGDERLCYSAVRNGCIVVSLDLWELAAADAAGLIRHHPGSRTRMLGDSELGQVLERIAREWAEEQGLGNARERQQDRLRQQQQQQQQEQQQEQQELEVHVQVSELSPRTPATHPTPHLKDTTTISASPSPPTLGRTPFSLSVPSFAITLPPAAHASPSPTCIHTPGHKPPHVPAHVPAHVPPHEPPHVPAHVPQASTVAPSSSSRQAARSEGRHLNNERHEAGATNALSDDAQPSSEHTNAAQNVHSQNTLQPAPATSGPTQQICLPIIIRWSGNSSTGAGNACDLVPDWAPGSAPDLAVLHVVGWVGSEGCRPEEDGPGVLRMLATLRGHFVPLQVTSVAQAGRGTLIAQVCISLPAAATASSTGSLLALELWTSGKLAAGHSTLLLPHSLASIAEELQGWATSLPEQQQAQQQQQHKTALHTGSYEQPQEQRGSAQSGEAKQQQQQHAKNSEAEQQQERTAHSSLPHCITPCPALDAGFEECGLFAFAGDLYVWMHIHSVLLQQMQEGAQRGEREGGCVREEESVAVGWQRELLCDVGRDLLLCSVSQGMTSLAELLLRNLQSPPLSLSFSSDICPREPQPKDTGVALQQHLSQQQQQQQVDCTPLPEQEFHQQEQQQQQLLRGEPSDLHLNGQQPQQLQQQQQQQQEPGPILAAPAYTRACTCPNCPPFPTWLLCRYKHVVILWSRIVALMTIADLVHPAVSCKPYKVLVVVMLALALGSWASLRWDAFRMVHSCVAAMALLQVAIAHQMSKETDAPSAFYYLDSVFCLATYMPYMFVLQLRPAALAAYAAVNLVVQRGFFARLIHKGSTWLPLLRAILCQGCVVCTHLVLTRKAYTEYAVHQKHKAQ